MVGSTLLKRLAILADSVSGEARLAVIDAQARLAGRLLLHGRPDRVPSADDRERAEGLAARIMAGTVWDEAGQLALDEDDLQLLLSLDPRQAARLVEVVLAHWPAAADADGERGALRQLMMGNALRELMLRLPTNLPLPVGTILRRRDIVGAVPRELLAWTLARTDAVRLAEWAAGLHAASPEHRSDRALWLRDIARQMDAPLRFEEAPRPRRGRPTSLDSDIQELAAPSGATATAAQQPARPVFHFTLEGEGASGSTLREHSDAELHFRFEVPSPAALATAEHPALDEARHEGVPIELLLTSRGAITIVGDRRHVAQVREGRLVQPVVFHLHAGSAAEAAAAQGEIGSGVHVEFVVKGETVHQMMLALVVRVADARGLGGTSEPVPAGRLSATQLADVMPATPPAHHRVRLSLSANGSSLHVELDHYVDGNSWWSDMADAPKLDSAALAALATSLRGDLTRIYEGAFWERFDGTAPAGQAVHPALARALECAAAAGSRLNEGLRQDAGLARLLDYIEQKVPVDALLAISTDSVFLPWELLTPQHWSLGMTAKQKQANPAPDCRRFWGVRFAVETMPKSVPVGERMRTHLKAPPRISVNLNPRITMTGLAVQDQPVQVQKDWAAGLQAQGLLDGPVNAGCLPMRQVLQDGEHSASLIYVYCHGSAASPFGGTDEMLQLDDECNLAPTDVQEGPAYTAAPIVFLNACQAGAHSPLAYSNFLKEFCRRGAIGLIATSHSVPITFGAHFGPEVVQHYLQRSGPMAGTLLALRRQHVVGRSNPVPLFYTLQCQLAFPPAGSAGGHP
jgi:hypothetical protein